MKFILIFILIAALIYFGFPIYKSFYLNFFPSQPIQEIKDTSTPKFSLPLKNTPTPSPLPTSKTIQNDYHIFQTFNNCGPAALSMALSYFGIQKSQAELGANLRPHNNPQGINDDKSVTLDELATEAEKYGLVAYHRPLGDINLLKQFISQGIPVVTRTWLHLNEDIGHYRVVKGYDDSTEQLIQDDSLENKNLRYSYSDFNELWKKFNYEYLVLVPKEKEQVAQNILGENVDSKKAWEKAIPLSAHQLQQNPDDIYARFNLSVAYHNIGNYQASVEEFERVESKLPFRTLWYQIEPIDSYYQLGNYKRVFEITDKILNNQNRAYSESYFLRGLSYLKQNQNDLAKAEFEKAVLYNKNFAGKIPQI